MSYAFTQDVPINAEIYSHIVAGLGEAPPKGMISHLAVERPEGGLRYIDIWETEADFERFAEERLHPVVHALLRPVFGDDLPPEPERHEMPVVHVWTA